MVIDLKSYHCNEIPAYITAIVRSGLLTVHVMKCLLVQIVDSVGKVCLRFFKISSPKFLIFVWFRAEMGCLTDLSHLLRKFMVSPDVKSLQHRTNIMFANRKYASIHITWTQRHMEWVIGVLNNCASFHSHSKTNTIWNVIRSKFMHGCKCWRNGWLLYQRAVVTNKATVVRWIRRVS